jgi:hypothetical protein
MNNWIQRSMVLIVALVAIGAILTMVLVGLHH